QRPAHCAGSGGTGAGCAPAGYLTLSFCAQRSGVAESSGRRSQPEHEGIGVAHMEFSQKLYNLLQRVEARLQTAASVSESAHSQAARELLDWCRAQDVPTHDWVTASKLLFSPQVLQVI